MQVKITAKLRNLRMSPQKVRLVINLIKKMSIDEALSQLIFLKKDAALPVKKLLESAVANAKHNYNIKEDTLKIENITADEGKILYRWMPRAMGRATPIRKRSSHIILTLVADKKEEEKKEKETKEIKTEKKVAKKAVKKTNLKTKNNK